MIFIKKLGIRYTKNNVPISFYLFFCEYCEQYVERSSGYKRCESCGCFHNKLLSKSKIKHGKYNTKLYKKYRSMVQRCYDLKCKSYKNYGERGIIICPEWTDKKGGFLNFYIWALNNGYTEELEINRINNNGNYEPNNCNFVTKKENTRVRRNVKLTLKKANEIRNLFNDGIKIMNIAKMYNISRKNIYNIINNIIWRNI